MTHLSCFTTSGVSSNQHDRVVVNGFHDLLLHGENGETGSLLGALHQSVVGLVALGPVVVDILKHEEKNSIFLAQVFFVCVSVYYGGTRERERYCLCHGFGRDKLEKVCLRKFT